MSDVALKIANNSKKQRVVVICPGRGTYNKEELGYFHRHHQDKKELLTVIDNYRQAQGQESVASLDTMPAYNMRLHTSGENASPLIYACSLADFHSIDKNKYDIVAITGNSMGWYIALAVAGALSPESAIALINTMGSMMKNGVIGGQLIYPIVDDNWHEDKHKIAAVEAAMAETNKRADCEVHVSIKLGGFIVLGGTKKGLKALEESLPQVDDRYPMNLFNHAAFHTPLLQEISEKAKAQLAQQLFTAPKIPLIDGQGKIWQPYSTDISELYEYTLGKQVVEYYDFTKAIEVAVKEFAPDKLIILGPGATLGGATAQSLIKLQWKNMNTKSDFIERQKQNPYILAMGIKEQRDLVVK
jgi:malonyl CoA-acyl carrier protein transacylase